MGKGRLLRARFLETLRRFGASTQRGGFMKLSRFHLMPYTDLPSDFRALKEAIDA